MIIRDRILGLRRVKASELRPNPKNWRTHPTRQKNALKGILADVGYADALIARETPDGLELIDGHLRAETTPDMEVPVLVVDLDEDEARKLLASLDPLAAMAGQDDELLRELLAGLDTDSEFLRDLWNDICPPELGTGLTDPDDIPERPGAEEDAPDPEQGRVRSPHCRVRRSLQAARGRWSAHGRAAMRAQGPDVGRRGLREPHRHNIPDQGRARGHDPDERNTGLGAKGT